MNPRQYRDLTADLASMLRSGVPLVESLESLARDKDSVVTRFAAGGRHGASRRDTVVRGLVAGVRSGNTLADALAMFPDDVPAGDIALVRAGEASGRLPEMLDVVVRRLDDREAFRRDVGKELSHRLLTAFVAMVLLPIPTAIIDGVGSYVALELAIFVPAIALGWAVWKGPSLWREGTRAREIWERVLLGVPWWGRWQAELATSRAFEALGHLLAAGLTFRDGIPLAAATSPWQELRERLRRAEAGIERGQTSSEALGALQGFVSDDGWRQRLKAGETAGTLDAALLEIARRWEERYRVGTKRLMGAVSVAIVIVVGVFVLRAGLRVFAGGYSI